MSVFSDLTEEFRSGAEEIKRIESKYGCSSPSWVSFLSDFKSSARYRERILDFLKYADQCDVGADCNSLVKCLLDYFELKRREKKSGEETPRFCGTTLRGWFSMFLKFWRYTGLGDLRVIAPILENNISKWEKTEVVVKAATFEKEDLG